MAVVYSSVSTKGGVGKTTLCRHLGIAKVKKGFKVLIIDLCQNGDVATRLGYDRYSFDYDTRDWVTGGVPFESVMQHDEETGIDFIPGSNLVDKIQEDAERKRKLRYEWVLKEKIDEIKDRYDYIFIDNHPSESGKMILMSMIASDIVLIPLMLDISALLATLRTVELIRDIKRADVDIDYKIVPFAVEFSKGFTTVLDDTKKLLKAEKDITNVTNTAIRYSSNIKKAGMTGAVIDNTNQYYKNVLADYDALAEELDHQTVLVER